MLDAALFLTVMGMFLLGLRRPFIWVLAYLYIDILAPQKIGWTLTPMLPISFIAFLLAFAGMAYPQVPNAGFEQWSVGFPGEWAVNNVPGLVTPVTASSVSHSGQWALRGEVVELAGASLPPFVSSASADGFAVAQRHAALLSPGAESEGARVVGEGAEPPPEAQRRAS